MKDAVYRMLTPIFLLITCTTLLHMHLHVLMYALIEDKLYQAEHKF